MCWVFEIVILFPCSTGDSDGRHLPLSSLTLGNHQGHRGPGKSNANLTLLHLVICDLLYFITDQVSIPPSVCFGWFFITLNRVRLIFL
jgi:hypothetical protein